MGKAAAGQPPNWRHIIPVVILVAVMAGELETATQELIYKLVQVSLPNARWCK